MHLIMEKLIGREVEEEQSGISGYTRASDSCLEMVHSAF
jgi:hypothetical protein